jgi:hypothetical protein
MQIEVPGYKGSQMLYRGISTTPKHSTKQQTNKPKEQEHVFNEAQSKSLS